MPAVGLFRAAELAPLADIDAWRRAMVDPGAGDAAFRHAPAATVAHTPHGLTPGRSVFGPGRSPAMLASATSVSPSREVTSVVLHGGTVLASSMTVLDRAGRLFHDGIDNLATPARLAGIDGHYTLADDGGLRVADVALAGTRSVDCIAMPVCGVGLPNYGHFLFDGLPAILLQAQLFADLDWRIVGPALAGWQRAILDALGLARRYLPIEGACRFRCVLASTLLALHVSCPTAFIRPMFDLLRFRAGAPRPEAPGRVFLSREGHDDRRRLRNRAEIEAAMAALGFAIVHPARLSFAEQGAVVVGAAFVVGESGAAMANLGFCQPGTKVLEIQPERFVEGWTRGLCFQLALRWHVYFARVDSPVRLDASGQPLDPNQHFDYDIDPIDLMAAILAIEALA